MPTANIATAKNHFSQLIQNVKQGQSVIITDRKRPVAILQPYQAASTAIQSLHLAGVLIPSSSRLNLKAFLNLPLPSLPPESSLSTAIRQEREEGR